ncbi:MAG: hypothetical protein COA36_17675 [Desulfotalea sp.]|nr:MAG: hypothetical protein COA36_17675 [Desulfotalea sp.]
MKKLFSTLTTAGLFINLYISLTFFWRISENIFSKGNFSISFVLLFFVILSIVIRHAQIIEVSFDISNLSPYMIGVIALALPQIKILVDLTPSEIMLCYLLISLILFEGFRLPLNRESFSLISKLINVLLLIAIVIVQNLSLANMSIDNGSSYVLIIYILFILNISYSLIKTCLTISPDISDRHDLYSLAYFSIASVLFNYCSENMTEYAEVYLKEGRYVELINSISLTEFMLFVFWITVLVRVVQSLHLAALDYKDTQLKGVDLAVLTLFYIFISTYWLISSHPSIMFWLFLVLFVLSLSVSIYFSWMRFYRIQSETKINIVFDNRIQTVNSVTFALVAISNYFLMLYGYNHIFIIFQIVILIFNMIHSYQLTMWIKFDLIFDKKNNPISFEIVKKSELMKITAYLSCYFGYIYQYTFDANKKKTRKIIYHLLNSSSRFGEFGRTRFFWIKDNGTSDNIGMICLKSTYNTSLTYSAISALSFVFRILFRTGPFNFVRLFRTFKNTRKTLAQLDLGDKESSVEIAYIVIDKKFRNKGYFRQVANVLRNINQHNKRFYPEKNYDLKNIYLIARSEFAINSFEKSGFCSVKTVVDNDFETATKQGDAQIMNCILKEC